MREYWKITFSKHSELIKPWINTLQKTNDEEIGNILLEANRFYLKQGFETCEAFNTKLAEHYHTRVALVDFSEPVTAATCINSWFGKATNDHISLVVQPSKLLWNIYTLNFGKKIQELEF